MAYGQNGFVGWIAKNAANAFVQLLVDAQGALRVSQGGSKSALNVTAATVIKAGAGRVARINVTVAGAAGTLSDCATTGAASAANLIMVVPATVGIYNIEWPFALGLVYTPGASQVASISYD